jgi:aryl-alcohol dehydrogenase-like predicted oxidoreductase
MNSKLGLGTVQFGKNYGINNNSGIVPKDEIFKILSVAKENGITLVDTATYYGKSEETLGKMPNIMDFEIVTKLPEKVENVEQCIKNSLRRLNSKILYGCLFHNFDTFVNKPNLWKDLIEFRTNGQIQKIGFSVYFPREIEYLLENKVDFNIIQLPYNLFDRRFEYLFQTLKDKNVEIHVRSVFLQGLFFRPIQLLSKHFDSVIEKLVSLNNYCETNSITLNQLLLSFVLQSKYIDKVIIGVESVENLLDNINASQKNSFRIKKTLIDKYQVNDENILIPYLWK